MINLQERRYRRHILQSPFLAVFLLVITLLLTKSVYSIYKKNQVANINRMESQRKLDLLVEKEKRLQAEIAKLNTTRGIEEELRSKFQVTKEGEEVLVVVDDPAVIDNLDQVSVEGAGLWSKFIKIFEY